MFSKGFTLIELMIAVAIVGILVTVAYPSYLEFSTRTHRSEGQRELVRVANLMEQFFLDHRYYPVDLAELGLNATSGAVATDSNLYEIVATQGNTFEFVLTATPQGAQATRDSDCGALTLDSQGVKGADGNALECWR